VHDITPTVQKKAGYAFTGTFLLKDLAWK